MTSTELEKVITQHDEAWHSDKGALMNEVEPTDVATYRASLEVAYQLALLNEQIGNVLNNRMAQIRVMVEQGEWPLTVQMQR